MFRRLGQRERRWAHPIWALLAGMFLVACGGGSKQDTGPEKTYLRVEATDPDGDTLQYQWRVTAGTIENKNARETVWTMPDGPGVHFAYVVVSDGKGGYAEQQYAVATDSLETSVPRRPSRPYNAKRFPADYEAGGTARLRFVYSTSEGSTAFGDAKQLRYVYMPDMEVQVRGSDGKTVMFSGRTDLSGEISLPNLANGDYKVYCATSAAGAFFECVDLGIVGAAQRRMTAVTAVEKKLSSGNNLRLYGHIAFKEPDGGICGVQNDFFGLAKAATVQLQQVDGTALTPRKRVNRFGDYALDAAVPVNGSLQLQIECDGYRRILQFSPDESGFLSTSPPVELSHVIDNQRPRIVKMVANGPEGNVRGRMIVPEAGAQSNGLPGPDQFLAYKGKDTPLSACKYYESLGAVESCDAQGRMINPISFADWKQQHGFGLGKDVKANYINRMDLNLVRRMVATQKSNDNIAFYVCNNPGPEGRSQAEVDELMAFALSGEREVACVAMEWSKSEGINNNLPFTKFLTFGPDGALIPSINLDGRGEKFMPGACVACHGGSKYNGRFPETTKDPSPDIGSRFLPFDLENFQFGSAHGLTRETQSKALRDLNYLVWETEKNFESGKSATRNLIDGWYRTGAFDPLYVGSGWDNNDQERTFYKEVIGAACRTCHTALGPDFNWDAINWMSGSSRGRNIDWHACGGNPDIAFNASMPNALVTRDRVAERAVKTEVANLMVTYLGCSKPKPDPGPARR